MSESLRICHTADWHVGKGRDLPDYLSRYRDALEEIADLVRRRSVDVLAVTGDVWDNKSPTEEERCLVNEIFSRILMENPSLVIIVIGGNHDWNTHDVSMLHSLAESYLPVGNRFRVVEDSPRLVTVRSSGFLCVPCTQRLGKNGLRSLVRKYLDGFEGDHFYVCLHEMFKCVNDFGKSLGYESIPKMNGVDFWLLGDIHKPQMVASNAWYCGSPLQHEFTPGFKKGCVLIESGKPRFVRLKRAKKLVVVYQGDDIPSNAVVKYVVTDPSSVDEDSLRGKVAAFSRKVEERAVSVDVASLNVLTYGLAEYLSRKFGFSEIMQKKAVKYVENISEGAAG